MGVQVWEYAGQTSVFTVPSRRRRQSALTSERLEVASRARRWEIRASTVTGGLCQISSAETKTRSDDGA